MTLRKLLPVLGFSLLLSCGREVVLEANPNLDPSPANRQSVPKVVDPMTTQQWNMKQVGMDQVWQQGNGQSRRITVAILGSGIDYTHEDLVNNVFVNKSEWKEKTPGKPNSLDQVDDDQNGYVDDFVGYDFVDHDGLPYDRHGSGTAMAGIIGAVADNGVGIRGIAPEISLLPVRFIDGSGQFKFPNLVSSIEYAVKMKADLIVLHLPSYVFKPNNAKVEKAMVAEVLKKVDASALPIVVSAGSSGLNLTKGEDLLSALRLSSNVIAVTAIDKNETRPAIANFGRDAVETSAPGEAVLSTSPGNSYQELSSTSLAASHVAGALALAINKNYGRITTRKMLEAFLKPEASDPVDPMKFETIGGNRLNIAKYLQYLSQN